MLSLATYIEYQLMTRHFAFVPGIGAWMLRDVEAEGLRAPHQEVFFNRFTCHDDGMTANLMMEAEGLTYDEAKARITYEAGQWISALERDGKMQINGVGWLYFDENRAIAFDTAPLATPYYFGLEEVVLQSLVEHQVEKKTVEPTMVVETEAEKETNETPVIAMERHNQGESGFYLWQHVAACLLIVFGLFTATRGSLTEADHQRDYASMVDIDVLLGKTTPYTLVPETWEEYIVSTDLLAEESLSTIEETDTDSKESDPPQKEPAPAIKPTTATWIDSQLATEHAMQSSPSGKLYYIIVASCQSNEEAQSAIARFAGQGYDTMNVLERDGRFRIYIQYFQVKDEAESQLQEIRQTTKFKDAWLLPVRAQSLSHIIKNTYNGNQLSMELPRLNPTAERDQG